MKKSIITIFICVLAGFLLGGGLVYHFNKKIPQIETIVMRDTIIQRDTITHTKIIKQDKYHYDTIVINDTIYIRDIPQVYSDSTDTYKIDINATKLYSYDLSIYKTDTFIKEIEKVSVIERKRGFGWNISAGVQMGYGININPVNMQAGFSPYIGVGISVGFGYSWK